MHRDRGFRLGLVLRRLWLPALLAVVLPNGGAAQEAATAEDSFWTRENLLPDWLSHRRSLDAAGLRLGAVYTGDFLANVDGGLSRESEYLLNLDLTLSWDTRPILERDLGTFFLYGLVDHGGSPSRNVGDAQFADNIDAPSTAKLYEAWWQKTLFDRRASVLLGLYDVNSEFYALESAEIFINSSFGIGAELGNSGVNGPSIFPSTSLGARINVEIVDGYEFHSAVLDGVPGDPNHPRGNLIEFNHGDGVFVIAEIANHGPVIESSKRNEVTRTADRRHVSRLASRPPDAYRVALGAWVYSGRIPHLSRTDANGEPVERRGHPGIYLIGELDAAQLGLRVTRGLRAFFQAGWADGDVGQFAGYAGGGLRYTGLIPGRPDDGCGFAVAAAFNGDAFKDASRARGESASTAEIALEWTYRAHLTPWLTLQGDLQYVIDPGGLDDRSNAVVVGFRNEITF